MDRSIIRPCWLRNTILVEEKNLRNLDVMILDKSSVQLLPQIIISRTRLIYIRWII